MLAEREAIRARREERERLKEARAEMERQKRAEAERAMDEDIEDLTDAERIGFELRHGLKKELANVGQGLRSVMNTVHGALKEAVNNVQERAGTSNR